MNKSRYKKLRLGKNETIDEHRLVAICVLDRWLDFNEIVHHKDGDSLNNSIENLEIMTRAEHMKLHLPPQKCSEALKKKLSEMRKGENAPCAKLTEGDVLVIRKKIKEGLGSIKLGKEFGVAHSTILQIKHRKSWKHI